MPKTRAPRRRVANADLVLTKVADALKRQRRTDTAEYAARRSIAIKRAHLVAQILEQDRFSLDDEGEADDHAMERIELLWLALNGSNEKKVIHQRAIIGAIGAARRRDASAPGRVEEVRASVDEVAPGALDGVVDESINAALDAADTKASLRKLLAAAKVPASTATIDKYAYPRRG